MLDRDAPTQQSTAEHFSFDSADYPSDERFERYRKLYAVGADAIEAGPRFEAGVRGWRLSRAVLYERRLNDVIHQRDARRVARDGFDHFTLTIVFSGRFEIDIGQGFRMVAPARGVLLDMARPMRNRSQAAHFVTISLARERVSSAAATTAGLHGMVLGRERLGLLFDFIQSLIERTASLGRHMLAPATHALTSLLSVALAGLETVEAGTASLTVKADRVDRVRAVINARILDPNLVPAMVAEASGLSRATLYRLFNEEGGIASYIQRCRLDILRASLIDPLETRSFASIAETIGFQSESHASRLFLEHFGMRPREYRTMSSQLGGANDRRMEYWLDELR